jgi:hypothetical protein
VDNPHIYFYLDVQDGDGNPVRWTCVWGAGALSARLQARRPGLGNTIVVDGVRAKNGQTSSTRRVTRWRTGELCQVPRPVMEDPSDKTAFSRTIATVAVLALFAGASVAWRGLTARDVASTKPTPRTASEA